MAHDQRVAAENVFRDKDTVNAIGADVAGVSGAYRSMGFIPYGIEELVSCLCDVRQKLHAVKAHYRLHRGPLVIRTHEGEPYFLR